MPDWICKCGHNKLAHDHEIIHDPGYCVTCACKKYEWEETIHELKTWPEYFEAVLKGQKHFEIRKNDRNFQVGDYLRLCEYDPDLQRFTGNYVKKRVTFILQGGFGLPENVCVMSLAPRGEG